MASRPGRTLDFYFRSLQNMVLIRILDGPHSGQSSDLSPGTHTVGRGKGADIALSSEAVSGKHLELTVADDGVVLFKPFILHVKLGLSILIVLDEVNIQSCVDLIK